MRRLTAITMALLLCPMLLEASPQSSHRSETHPVTTRARTHRTVQFGVASWYGRALRGRKTASGTPYDERELTAAHRTLPLGTSVKVTNLKNGRSVVLKVTDRGPWVRTRLIDVSRAAADILGFRHKGVTRVKVSVIHRPASEPASSDPAAQSSGNQVTSSPR